MSKIRIMATAAVGVLGLGIGLGTATPASAADVSQPLAAGAVVEGVSGGNWDVQFAIASQGSVVAVEDPVEAFSFTGSLCDGTYTDPVLGGTTVYTVGQQTSYKGSGADNEPYYAFKVHEGGAHGADYSWVNVGLTSLSAAQSACASPAATLSNSYFPVVAGSALFFH